MAIFTFLTFSGMGVTFLIYVLIRLWQESRRLLTQDARAAKADLAAPPSRLVEIHHGQSKPAARVIVMPAHHANRKVTANDQGLAKRVDQIRRTSVSARWGRHEL